MHVHQEELAHARAYEASLAFAPLRPFIGMSAYSRDDALASTGYSNIGKIARTP